MIKKIISVMLTATLMTTLLIPTTSASTTDKTIETAIFMNGEEIITNEDGNYIYIAESLESLPVLSCRFDETKYSSLITQPTRENGYTGTVTLTSLSDSSITEYTINVYDNNTFQSHFINLGGDPWVTYHDGWYYYMYTGNGFYISKSRDLSRVNSNPVSVYNLSALEGTEHFTDLKELWAPELHFIDGFCYIYFTAYDGALSGGAKNHRMYVLKSDTSDAQGSYTFIGQINELEEDYINDAKYDTTAFKPSHYAIDQSIFKWKGKLYAVWSGWPSYESIGQRIYIAEMSDPYTISSNRVELSRPEFAYETYSMIPAINEGPQALISPDGNVLNIAFSVNRFDDAHYSLGLLTLKEDGNPLNADDWIKTEDAVFETNEESSTYSVGHCSFVPSPDNSEYYVIYHARRGADVDANPREIRVQQFYWNDDGMPCFDKAISATTPVEIPSGTAIIDRTKIEAENGTLSGNAFIPTAESGITTYDPDYYSGGKRVAITSADSAVTFTYNAPKAGKYTLSLLASGNHATVSGFAVTANGNVYNRKLGGNGNSINTFYYYDITGVELTEGENTVTVSYTSKYKNGGYLDRIDIWNEDDAASVTARQDAENLESTKEPVIREKITTERKATEYGKETVFDSFGDFDKYWYNSQPFRQEYGDAAITTCRPGGNKRLLVSDKSFHNISDFKASVEITPSAAHTALDNNVEVKEENYTTGVAINSGIIFRVGEMRDYTSNVVSFSGYRCFLIATGNNQLKIQAHKYYFTDQTSQKATNKTLALSSAISYTPGDTYILEIEVNGNTLNAKAYNVNNIEETATLTNINLKPDSTLEYEDSGRIGLYSMPITGRVTFANLKITPYYSPASITSDYGNLNQLSAYTSYTGTSTRIFSDDKGIITIPTGVSKLILNSEAAQDVADFKANAKIKLTNSSATIQTGFGFRMSDVTTGSPGLTGYAVFLQRKSEHNNNTIVINLTKYGTNGTTANQNLGNQSFVDTVLLSDITDKEAITGLEFYFDVTVKGNKMMVTVTRADNKELSSTYNWQLDNTNYDVNKKYPVYYESGMIGIFSNGVAKISEITINKIKPEEYDVVLSNAENGNASANVTKAKAGKTVSLTLRADNGYYIDFNKLAAVTEDGSVVAINTDNMYWDNAGVYTFTLPENTVNINYGFTPYLKGDSNSDGITDIKDLVRSKKYLAGIEKNAALTNADMDSNRILNANDLVDLKKLLQNL